MIELLCHSSHFYGPRTWHNAAQGVTLAIAADHTTAGEKLTQKAAAKNGIVMLDAKNFYEYSVVNGKRSPLWVHAARELYSKLKASNMRVVNVAGNGIYTLEKYGISQLDMNDMVRQVLFQVDQHWKLDKVVSGGQTGADLAGLIASAKIGIPCTGMWPAGFKMRFSDGVDKDHTYEQVMEIINQYA